jgi:phospholipid transport system substrate-binding protein
MKWLVAIAAIMLANLLYAAESSPAYNAVAEFHDRLMEMSRLGSQVERERFVREPLRDLFDIERITKVSVGRTWRKLDEAVQQNLLALVGELIVATYASRFDADRGQKFTLLGSETVRRGMVVRSEIKPAGRDAVNLDYFFQNGKVFNVAANGVSDLSLRRADYSAVLKTDGLEGLIEHLELKLQELRAE